MAALRSALRGARKNPKIALDYLARRYRGKYDARPQVVQQFNFAEMMRRAIGEDAISGSQGRRPELDAGEPSQGEIPGGAGGETVAPGEEPAP